MLSSINYVNIVVMTGPETHPSHEAWIDKPYTAADERVYSQLLQEMYGTSHGSLFGSRELDSAHDPLGLLHLENAFIPAHTFDAERFDLLKNEILWKLIITRPAFEALVDSMDAILSSELVAKHTAPDNNGSLLWGFNHISYADAAALLAARTEVNLRHGVANPTKGHSAITSRIISIFELSVLAPTKGEDGYVVDHGLLYMGGILQTVPASASGSRVRKIVDSSHDINEPVRQAYYRELNKGTEWLIAVSGEQDKVDNDGRLIMGTVSKGTVDLATQPNQIKGAERLLTIPVFMDCHPFDHGEFTGAVDATHKILDPRFLHDETDVTHMMFELAYNGTVEKRPGTPPIAYRRPTRMSHVLGRIGMGGSSVYAD